MSMRRIPGLVFFAAVVALLLVSAGPPSAAAAPAFGNGPVTVTRNTVKETVEWSMDPGVCRELRVPLNGKGERHQETITTTFADGRQSITINDLVSGTAWDSTGTYKFFYANHRVDTIPAGSTKHSVSMIDSFILRGNGSARLDVAFNWRWTYDSATEDYWPPVHDVQKFYTRGDPLTCDPI